MKIYRAMTANADGLPQLGRSARELGVRTADRLPHNDVRASNPNDLVNPDEGMSAAPNDPANLGKNRRPPQLSGGVGKDPVWEIDADALGPDLHYVRDKPTHGVVAPLKAMTLEEFERALAATLHHWVRVIG